MGLISDAVGSERVAKVIGYELNKGDFSVTSPNLPQRIAIFGQANTDKQSGLTNDPVQFTSENEVGNLFGFGSQLHIMARIVRGITSDIVGGIPTFIYPQLAPGGAAAEIQEITITGGPADKAGTIAVRINGRDVIDGSSLLISIASGDAVADVATKIADAVNACLPCPVSASAALGVVTLTTKWQSEAAANLQVEVLTGDDNLSLAYAVASTQSGAGSSVTEISSSLALFGNEWNTIVINPYDKATTNSLFEAFNGTPGEDPGTGRYAAIIWKPFVCLTGETIADTVANVILNLDKDEGTIVQCPAPNSKGWPFEAAANVAALLARQAQDSPHLDVSGKQYLDMPVPDNGVGGVFDDYDNRDLIVKGGAATVIINNGKYQIEDLVTTYHPDGENPPQFRYVRALVQDFNFRYGYFLLEQVNVIDKAIIANDQISRVSNTVKPDQWKGILFDYADDLEARSLITDKQFMKDNITVGLSPTNPDRFETDVKYKRSGFTRIASTTATAGFFFG